MRPSLETTMLQMATFMSARATCVKLAVGCILTDNHGRILSAGYNGVPSKWSHCNKEHRCKGPCLATHAESNALLSCRDIQAVHTCYVTHSPCLACIKQLIQTPCYSIVYLYDTAERDIAYQYWNNDSRSMRKAA